MHNSDEQRKRNKRKKRRHSLSPQQQRAVALKQNEETILVAYLEKECSKKVSLFLHEFDRITEDKDIVFSLDYEFYQGYIIYSTNEGTCCIHGADQRGCLKLENKFVSFPDSTHAMRLIDYFQANGWDAYLHMSRRISTDVYLCLNAPERESTCGGTLQQRSKAPRAS